MKYEIEPNGHVRITDDDSNKKSGCSIVVVIFLLILIVIAIVLLIKRAQLNNEAYNSSTIVSEKSTFADTNNSVYYSDDSADNTSNFEIIPSNQIEELSDYFCCSGHSYKLYRVYDITGRDIINYCANLGGYLAHINDSSENEFIASTIGTLGYDIVYFGYSDEQSEGNWYWIDGENSSFVNWRSGEPNNEANAEHYALISPDGTWNDGKLERDSQSGAIILCEWNTSIETGIPHLSDYHSHIINVSSSSHLENQTYSDKTYVYTAEKAFDKDMSTCWSEGLDGYGIGESITVSFDNIYEVSEVSIWNGLCTSEDLYNKNSRLHNFTVVLSDGS